MKAYNIAAAVPKPDRYAGEVVCLYVQLKEGADLTVEEIMEPFEEKTSGRGPRFPKEIIDPMRPFLLQGFGKVYKPALQWDAVRRAYENELSVLEGPGGMAERSPSEEDRLSGKLIVIRIKPAS